MKSFVIGRSPHADVVLADSSIARHHAEVVVTDDGRYYLTDCATEFGTWRAVGLKDDEEIWEPTRQAFVAPDQPLKLGSYLCTLEALLATAVAARRGDGTDGGFMAPQEPGAERPRGPVERDPRTGEIIRKRV